MFNQIVQENQAYQWDLSDQDGIYNRHEEHTSNIVLPGGLDAVLMAIWIALCLVGFAVMFIAHQKIAGAVIIAVPTFVGMVLKPGFALCVFMLVLPSGASIAVEGQFSLNKGVGIAMALSFLLNVMLSRPRLKMRERELWLVSAYFTWSIFAVVVNGGISVLSQIFTRVQYMAFFLIVYWILETNKRTNFLWILRSFLAGAAGTVALAFITGMAIRAVEEDSSSGGRLTATVGGAINANSLSAMLGLAMFSAIYLLVRDRMIILRIIYSLSILFLGVMIFKTGSRGTLLAIVATFMVISFGRHVMKNPLPILGVLVILGMFLGTGYFLIKTGRLQEDVAERLTDVARAQESISGRMTYNKAAINVARRRLTGAGYYTWFIYTEVDHFPHNDLLYSIGVYGFPAGLLFLSFVICMMLRVKRMHYGLEKMFAKAILTFLLLIGLKGMYVGEKFYWVFLSIVIISEKFADIFAEQPDTLKEQLMQIY